MFCNKQIPAKKIGKELDWYICRPCNNNNKNYYSVYTRPYTTNIVSIRFTIEYDNKYYYVHCINLADIKHTSLYVSKAKEKYLSSYKKMLTVKEFLTLEPTDLLGSAQRLVKRLVTLIAFS